MQGSTACSLPDRRFMEIEFKKIGLEDRELIDRYLNQKTYRSCELIFPNIYLWSMVPLSVKFFAGQRCELFRLIDVIGKIPVICYLEFPRIP